MVVVKAVVELQERALPQRLSVRGIDSVAQVVGGSEVISVGLVGGVIAQPVLDEVQVYVGCRHARAVLTAPVDVGPDGDVAPP